MSELVVLGNVAHQSIFHGNSDRPASVGKDLQVGKQVIANNAAKTPLDSVEIGKRRLDNSSPDIAAVRHLRSDLTLIKIQNGRWSHIFSGVVKLAEHFSRIFSEGSYICST